MESYSVCGNNLPNFLAATDKAAFLISAIDAYRQSEFYQDALTSEKYYRGRNSGLLDRQTAVQVGNRRVDLTAAIRVPTGVYKRLITQLVQSIWAHGVQLETPEMKNQLGRHFDKIAEGISRWAAIHGVSYGFWNYDKLQQFTAREYFPLKDERTSEDMAGVRFWRLSDDKPMFVQLYELDGWTEYRREKNAGVLTVTQPKQPYRRTVRSDAISATVIGGKNYNRLPVIAMYSNDGHENELTPPIKSKIDLYDFILSSFGDSVMRTFQKAQCWQA